MVTAPKRKPSHKAGLSGDQENALLAIEMVMSEMKAHGDGLSQWRLAQIERALAALDRGQHREAMRLVERARCAAHEISEADRAEAAHLERQIEIDQLLAAVTARRQRL